MATNKNTNGSNGTEPSPIMKDEIVWDKMNQAIKSGDVIRIQNFENYYYGISTGLGFGCDPKLIGGAIYVKHQSMNLEATLSEKDGVNGRWERSWGIEIMRRVRYIVCADCGGIMEADFEGDCEEFTSYQANCDNPKHSSGTVYFNIMKKDNSTDPETIEFATATDRKKYIAVLRVTESMDGQ